MRTCGITSRSFQLRKGIKFSNAFLLKIRVADRITGFSLVFLKHSDIPFSILRMGRDENLGIAMDECFFSLWPYLSVSNKANDTPWGLPFSSRRGKQ